MSEIKLMLGDCLERMKEIPDRSVDMVLCDLPYGLTQNRWDSVIPFDPLWNEYKRITKSNAVIAIFASQPFSSAIVMSNPKMFKHEWIWIKNRGGNFANTVREPMKEHEHVLIFSNGKWTYNKQMQERTGGGAERVKYRFNKITESKNYGKFDRASQSSGKLRVPSSWQKFNVEVGFHPTQKPVALLEYLIKTYTNEGETVLDNCAGSMSTVIACLNTSRNCIAIEKDENYFNMGCERVKNHILENNMNLCYSQVYGGDVIC